MRISNDWWYEFERELGYPDMPESIDETAFENQPGFGNEGLIAKHIEFYF